MAKIYEKRFCEICGTEFTPKRIDGRYCSRECRSRASHKARNSIARTPIKQICINCGREYDSMQFGKFCSADCRAAHRKSAVKQPVMPHRSDGNSNWQAAQEAMQNGDALGYWANRQAWFIENAEKFNKVGQNLVGGVDVFTDNFEYMILYGDEYEPGE